MKADHMLARIPENARNRFVAPADYPGRLEQQYPLFGRLYRRQMQELVDVHFELTLVRSR
jgi:hypothetical protein